MEIPQKTKIELSYDPEIPLQRKPWLEKIHIPSVHCGTTYNSQHMESTSSSMDRGVEQAVYIYTMEYYSAI